MSTGKLPMSDLATLWVLVINTDSSLRIEWVYDDERANITEVIKAFSPRYRDRTKVAQQIINLVTFIDGESYS